MKKIGLFFLLAFACYLLGHLLWSWSIACDDPFFLNEEYELWLINIPFALFALFGFLASYRLYKYS